MIEPADSELQGVLDGIVETTARLFGAPDVVLFLIDGDQLRRVAAVGVYGDAAPAPMRDASGIPGRVILGKAPFQVEDVQALPEGPVGRHAREEGFRTVLG